MAVERLRSTLKVINAKSCTQKVGLLKRARQESEDSGNENAAETVSLSKRLKKDLNQVYVVTRGEILAYFKLLEDPFIHDFLVSDSCMLYSDKYLLAMVFAYFKRANFTEKDYTKLNFFLALFLANDMEEDEEDFKFEILPWALGGDWKKKVSSFLHERDMLWEKMSYRAVVSSKCCEEVMSMEPLHWAWRRERAMHHSGAIRSYTRDIDFCEPRGPHESPRGLCDDCTMLQMIQEVVTNEDDENGTNSWFLSSSSSSSSSCSSCCSDESFDEGSASDVVRVKDGRRFSMKGIKQTLSDNTVLCDWIVED